MARSRMQTDLTLAQLEQMLERRKSDIGELERERAKLQKKIDDVDAKIRELGGAAGATAGGRVRNPKSLIQMMTDALAEAGGPMGVGDITQAVTDAGYHSNSSSFRSIVNQTLIKERRRFSNTGRGMYQLKSPAAGKAEAEKAK